MELCPTVPRGSFQAAAEKKRDASTVHYTFEKAQTLHDPVPNTLSGGHTPTQWIVP